MVSTPTPDPPERAYLKPEDVAAQIGMSVSFVYKEVRRGNIAFEKRGRVFRFTQSAVNAWVNRNHHAAAPADQQPE